MKDERRTENVVAVIISITGNETEAEKSERSRLEFGNLLPNEKYLGGNQIPSTQKNAYAQCSDGSRSRRGAGRRGGHKFTVEALRRKQQIDVANARPNAKVGTAQSPEKKKETFPVS